MHTNIWHVLGNLNTSFEDVRSARDWFCTVFQQVAQFVVKASYIMMRGQRAKELCWSWNMSAFVSYLHLLQYKYVIDNADRDTVISQTSSEREHSWQLQIGSFSVLSFCHSSLCVWCLWIFRKMHSESSKAVHFVTGFFFYRFKSKFS